jgi:hypothetical protein
VKSMLGGIGMSARKLGIICAFLAAIPNLVGCGSSQSPDVQFEKQVKRAQECRRLQDQLVGDQPLTPERGEEIAIILGQTGCTASLPSADAGASPRFPAQR